MPAPQHKTSFKVADSRHIKHKFMKTLYYLDAVILIPILFIGCKHRNQSKTSKVYFFILLNVAGI